MYTVCDGKPPLRQFNRWPPCQQIKPRSRIPIQISSRSCGQGFSIITQGLPVSKQVQTRVNQGNWANLASKGLQHVATCCNMLLSYNMVITVIQVIYDMQRFNIVQLPQFMPNSKPPLTLQCHAASRCQLLSLLGQLLSTKLPLFHTGLLRRLSLANMQLQKHPEPTHHDAVKLSRSSLSISPHKCSDSTVSASK